MKEKILILTMSLLLLLSGCTAAPPENQHRPLYRAVTQITVDYENGPIQATLNYTEDEKMRLILNYLRLIRPYGTPPEDPEAVDGSLFRITLTHSDGSTKVYEQKADRYLKAHGKNWQCISSQKAMELSILLGQLESDGIREAANIM